MWPWSEEDTAYYAPEHVSNGATTDSESGI